MTTTFRDFQWSSQHFIASKHGASALPHWHNYKARFWFKNAPDQDTLAAQLEKVFGRLHGCALNTFVQPASTDEGVAEWLLSQAQQIAPCIRVLLENDGLRGAEAEL